MCCDVISCHTQWRVCVVKHLLHGGGLLDFGNLSLFASFDARRAGVQDVVGGGVCVFEARHSTAAIFTVQSAHRPD